MVERFLQAIEREISGLHEAAYLLAGFVFASQLLALVRDRLLARSFGASADLDVYYAAFRIPDFLYITLASLVASAVLIPFITQKLEHKGEAERFFNSIFTLFFCCMVLVSIIVFFAMPFLARFVAPGLSGESQAELFGLSRIILLSPILLGLSGLFASVTQSLRRFFVYAISPVLYNIGIIIGIIFFYPTLGLSGLAYGVVLGALLHMLIQIPVLLRNNFVPRFTVAIQWREIGQVFSVSLPRAITLSAHHLTLFVLIALASLMEEGSIAIFNFSFNLQSVPLAIIGVSYSVAAFPTLSRLFTNGDRNAFGGQMVTAIRHIIFWSMPVLVLFIVLRAQIVRTILGTGAFDWADTRLTAAALALFVVSVLGQSLMLIFVRGYYAAGRTLKPLVINVCIAAGIIVTAFILVKAFSISAHFRYFLEALFRVEELPGTIVIVLPLAFSIGAILNAGILWICFEKDFSLSFRDVFLTFRQSFYAAVLAGFVAYQGLNALDDVFDLDTFFGITMQGFISGMLGICAWALILVLMKNKEIHEIGQSLHGAFWMAKPVAPCND